MGLNPLAGGISCIRWTPRIGEAMFADGFER